MKDVLKLASIVMILIIAFAIFASCEKDALPRGGDPGPDPVPTIEPAVSCVDYGDLKGINIQSSLEVYWDKFVDDALCSASRDFSERSHILGFENYDLSSGVTPDHAGRSFNSCGDQVNVGVVQDWWNGATEVQKLWLFYHEMGHAIYEYNHFGGGIMAPSVTGPDTHINDFISAKDDFFKRRGAIYINCDN